MPRIVTVTLNPAIDRVYRAPGLHTGDTALLEPLAIRPGGKGLNVSRSLARLNIPSICIAPVAHTELDNFRAEFSNVCAGLVADALVPTTPPMRHTITLLDPEAPSVTHLREPGHPLQEETLAEIESRLVALANPDTIIAFCGSLPPSALTTRIAAKVRALAATGAILSIDASSTFLRECASIPGIILKVNQHEWGAMAGVPIHTPADVVRAARAHPHLRACVITLGSEGVVLSTPDLALHAQTPVPASENPFCTVGCGDAAHAGFLAALPHALPDALRSASAAGTSAAFSREPGTIFQPSYTANLHSTLLREVRL